MTDHVPECKRRTPLPAAPLTGLLCSIMLLSLVLSACGGAPSDGKIHLTVGTADTFYLDGAAHRLEATMARVGAHASFTYLPNKTHMDLYERNGDKQALTKDIARAIYIVARPHAR